MNRYETAKASGRRRIVDLGRARKAITFLVVASGFVTLILTGTLSTVEIGVIVLSLPIAWFWGERIVAIPRADTVANVAIILIFLLALIGFFILGRSFVAMTTGFLIFVQAVRLLFLTEMRHYLQVYLISLFSVLAATVLTFSPVFLISFVVYLCLATAGMIVLTITGDVQRVRGTLGGVELSVSYLSWLTLGSVAFTVTMSVIIFVVFPRLSAGFLPSSIVQPVRVPGFSNNVELGEVGDLKISGETIMRVVVDEADAGKLGSNVYWRGTAFDTFDGKYWEKSVTKATTVRRTGTRFILDAAAKGRPIHQEYYLESTDSRVLFVLSRPTVVSGPFMNLAVDRYGTVEMAASVNDKIHYAVDSIPGEAPGTGPTGGRLSEDELNAYLELPDDLDPRIPTLVSEIVGDERAPLAKAALIRDWLVANMSYDLNPKGMGADPLAAFLFDEKKGYCEHFATAMAVMLRVTGVPTRMVTGFLGGGYNEIGSFYIVRASDAHAWVEVYSDPAGWTTFEATPPAGLSAAAGGSVIRELMENLVMKWNVYVVNYEMGDQIRMIEGVKKVRERGRKDFSSAGGTLARFLAQVREKRGALFIPGTAAAALVCVALIGYIVRVLVTGRTARRLKGGEIGRIYRSAVRFLSKKGVEKRDSMTPREFAGKARQAYPDIGPDIEALTGIYYRHRFGRGGAPAEGVGRARGLLERIKRAL
jgi:transglutaminase-like putative cysteine protease